MGNNLIEQKVSHCPTGGGLVSGQQPSFFAGCPSVGTMFTEVLEGVKDLVGGQVQEGLRTQAGPEGFEGFVSTI